MIPPIVIDIKSIIAIIQKMRLKKLKKFLINIKMPPKIKTQKAQKYEVFCAKIKP